MAYTKTKTPTAVKDDADQGECESCGSHLSNRKAKQGDDKSIPLGFIRCTFCQSKKCCMCDMGDDVECLSCSQGDVDDS